MPLAGGSGKGEGKANGLTGCVGNLVWGRQTPGRQTAWPGSEAGHGGRSLNKEEGRRKEENSPINKTTQKTDRQTFSIACSSMNN